MADELKPEERARIKIDEQLADAGWHIADRGGVTYEHNAIALVEGLLEGNKEADYLLFVDGKVVGVLEAKRSDIDLESAARRTLASSRTTRLRRRRSKRRRRPKPWVSSL